MDKATLEAAAKMCRRQIAKEMQHGRLQAQSILERCALAILALADIEPVAPVEAKHEWQSYYDRHCATELGNLIYKFMTMSEDKMREAEQLAEFIEMLSAKREASAVNRALATAEKREPVAPSATAEVAKKMRSSDEPSERVSLPVEECRWLDEILGLLGMHEEGDPVERVRELLDHEIAWLRKLATPQSQQVAEKREPVAWADPNEMREYFASSMKPAATIYYQRYGRYTKPLYAAPVETKETK